MKMCFIFLDKQDNGNMINIIKTTKNILVYFLYSTM